MCNGEIYLTGEAYDKAIIDNFCKENGMGSIGALYLDDISIEKMSNDRSGRYRNSARAIFFPSGFKTGVEASVMKKAEYKCQNCGKNADTIDHIEPVSAYFNREGYLKSREERVEWYNDEENLQALCRSCNSKKGGSRFGLRQMRECIQNNRV